MRSLALSVCTALMVASGHAATITPSARVTGIYSDMVYNRQGGDVLGTEIFIVYSRKGYFVSFQSSEGEPPVPVIIKALVAGSSIEFDLPPDVDTRGHFVGTINDSELRGSFASNGQTIHLKRKNSYWQ